MFWVGGQQNLIRPEKKREKREKRKQENVNTDSVNQNKTKHQKKKDLAFRRVESMTGPVGSY
jgi:hypothetical protein